MSAVVTEKGLRFLAASNIQVICVTHSPILAATPGADHRTHQRRVPPHTWDELELVHHWRRYFTDPTVYLRHITE